MKLNFKQIFYVVFLTVTILSAKEFDLFIKNGRVMDGTGNPWFYADVGINGSKIVYVGPVHNTTILNKKIKLFSRKNCDC